MKSACILSGVLTICMMTFAQPPDSLWSHTFGGASIDQAYCVRQTTDGGYIMTGWTQSFGAGGYDMYVIKTNGSGDSLWTRVFGGTGEDRGLSVVEDTDGYVIAGRTSSHPVGNENVWLVKVDFNGDTLWTRVYGGASAERAYSIQKTFDGGFVVAGNTGTGTASDFWLIKTDANGDSTWSRRYGTASVEDWCNDVQQTSDSGYVLAGYTGSGTGQNMWMVKTNADGDSLWSRSYGTAGITESCRSVAQTTDGGYVLGGNASPSGIQSMWLVKTDANGDTTWTRRFGTTSGVEECYSVQQTFDGGYVLAGYYDTNGDAWVVKTDANGDSTWSRRMGGSNGELFYSVRQTADSGYVLAGYTMTYGAGSNDAWIVRLGAATPEPEIMVTPTQLAFGNVQVGDSVFLPLRIHSTGDVGLSVTQITASAPFYAEFQDPVFLPPGDSLIIFVTFRPTQVMNSVDTLRVISDAPSSPTPVRLTGTGTAAPQPDISVSPLQINFGTVFIGDSAALPLHIVSTGTGNLTVSSLLAPSDFYTDFDPPQVISPGDTLLVQVTFAPSLVRAYTDSLFVYSNAPASVVLVQLFGTGLATAAHDVNSLPLSFVLSAYPNPFNPATEIRFNLPRAGRVSLRVLDVLGREVAILQDGFMDVGIYHETFDGAALPSGIYFARLQAGDYMRATKLLLIK